MVHRIVLGLLASILQCCYTPRSLSDYMVYFFPFIKYITISLSFLKAGAAEQKYAHIF